jgi:hypothetical protein
MKTYNKITVNTFNHNLIIEQRDHGVLVYNDNNGDEVFFNFDLTSKIMSKNKHCPITIIKTFTKFFTYDQVSAENVIPLLGTVALEIEFYKLKINLKKVFNINNYSDYCLLAESLEYAKYSK